MQVVNLSEVTPDFDSEIGVRIAVQIFKDFFVDRSNGYFEKSTFMLSEDFTKIAQYSEGVSSKDIITASGILGYRGFFIDKGNVTLKVKFKNAHFGHVYNALIHNPPETRHGPEEPVRALKYDVTDIIRN